MLLSSATVRISKEESALCLGTKKISKSEQDLCKIPKQDVTSANDVISTNYHGTRCDQYKQRGRYNQS